MFNYRGCQLLLSLLLAFNLAVVFVQQLNGLNALSLAHKTSGGGGGGGGDDDKFNDFLGYDLENSVGGDYQNNYDAAADDDDLIRDFAVKLKKEYADDFVAELFALTHGLIKVAKVNELDQQNRLYHFKLVDMPNFNDENMNAHEEAESQTRTRHRIRKRHVEHKVETLKSDERVEYVIPQRLLKRHKRTLDDDNDGNDALLEQLVDYLDSDPNHNDDDDDRLRDVYKRKLTADHLRKAHASSSTSKTNNNNNDNANDEEEDEEEEEEDNENVNLAKSDLDYLKENLYSILKDNSIRLDDRKKIYELFNDANDNMKLEKELAKETQEINNEIDTQNLPDVLKFNDKNFNQQWYLINKGQFNTLPVHDLNVKEAWLKGYTGKNRTIVIVDDGLDYEHSDFAGKYVIFKTTN